VSGRPRQTRWVRGAGAGFVGGLVAAGAMSVAHALNAALAAEPEDAAAPQGSKEEDATVKVAAVVTGLAGRQLEEAAKPMAGTLVHYAFGGLVGAAYGVAAEVVPTVTAAVGLSFGVAVWLGAHVVTVPALGLAEPPTRRPVRKEAEEFGLHLVYGVTTELVRRLLRG
jgi:putative membrane protein